MKDDEIWTVSREVRSKNGTTATGLRDLFDANTSGRTPEEIQAGVEIIQAICEKVDCTFYDIFKAFMDYYDNDNYKHIIPYSYKGVWEYYMALHSREIDQIIDSPKEFPDGAEVSKELNSIYTSQDSSKVDRMIACLRNSYPIKFVDFLFHYWRKKYNESFTFFTEEIISRIDDKLKKLNSEH